jgi:hypothetical protein
MREELPVNTPVPSYRQQRSPAEIFAHRVRLSYRFPLRRELVIV